MRIVRDYDYLILGAGAAGLNLAHQLNRAGLSLKRILLVDRAPRLANDRTWCFWERGPNCLEKIVFRAWPCAQIFADGFVRALDLAPYSYKMIRGGDFFAHLASWLGGQPNIEVRYGDVTHVHTEDGRAVALVDGAKVSAEFAFSSIPCEPARGITSLLQHFYGAVIRASQPCFNPALATLMDFRVPQHGHTRFCYVLPFDERSALVEFTVFSPAVLPRADYARELRAYIARVLRIDQYAITHEEYGVIPMTDARFAAGDGACVINIGTAGGQTKPSTGYTFLRVQQHAKRLAAALAAGRNPSNLASVQPRRHALFDSIFLNVLARNRRGGAQVFTELFARNPPQRVLRFLDEQSSLGEDLRLMAGMHWPSFAAAAVDVLWRRTLRG